MNPQSQAWLYVDPAPGLPHERHEVTRRDNASGPSTSYRQRKRETDKFPHQFDARGGYASRETIFSRFGLSQQRGPVFSQMHAYPQLYYPKKRKKDQSHWAESTAA